MKKLTLKFLLPLALTLGVLSPASAADLSNAKGVVGVGECTWHFVNNQTGGYTGKLNVDFYGVSDVLGVWPYKVLRSVLHFSVTTSGNAKLINATTGKVPGKLVLSDYSCKKECDNYYCK